MRSAASYCMNYQNTQISHQHAQFLFAKQHSLITDVRLSWASHRNLKLKSNAHLYLFYIQFSYRSIPYAAATGTSSCNRRVSPFSSQVQGATSPSKAKSQWAMGLSSQSHETRRPAMPLEEGWGLIKSEVIPTISTTSGVGMGEKHTRLWSLAIAHTWATKNSIFLR